MFKSWDDEAWDDYLYWQNNDKKTLRRIIPANEMIFRWMREDFCHEARKVERGVLNRT